MNKQEIKETVAEALKEVFTEGDTKEPEMKILIRRIPILCTNVEAMHKSIEKMEDNIIWIVRLIIGAVVLAGLTIILNK